MSISIAVPKTLTHASIVRMLRLLEHTNRLQGAINLDCSQLKFIDPMGLCMLHHWLRMTESRDVTVYLLNLHLHIEKFLQRMDVFKGFKHIRYDDRTSHDRRNLMANVVVEVRVIHDQTSIDEVSEKLAKAIVCNIPGMSFEPDPEGMRASEGEHAIGLISYVFAEMLLNALDHGRKKGYRHATATVAAAFYPSRNSVDVAILDDGCGLLGTLQGHPRMEGENSHLKAVEIALQPRVSCNRDAELGLDSRNQGIGLTMTTSIALATAGGFGVFSGDGWVNNVNGRVRAASVTHWQGTGVYLSFQVPKLGITDRGAVLRQLPGFRTVDEIQWD